MQAELPILCDFPHRILSLTGNIQAETLDRITDYLFRLNYANCTAARRKPIILYISSSCRHAGIEHFLWLANIIELIIAPVETIALPGIHEAFGTLVLSLGCIRYSFPGALFTTAGLRQPLDRPCQSRFGFQASAADPYQRIAAWTEQQFHGWIQRQDKPVYRTFENGSHCWTASEARQLGLLDHVLTPELLRHRQPSQKPKQQHQHATQIPTHTP